VDQSGGAEAGHFFVEAKRTSAAAWPERGCSQAKNFARR